MRILLKAKFRCQLVQITRTTKLPHLKVYIHSFYNMFQKGPLIYWMWTANKFHNRLIMAKRNIYTGRIKYQMVKLYVLKATIKKEE